MHEYWEDLANAIIERAAIDYGIVLKKLAAIPPGREHQPMRDKLNRERRKIERFFRSKWYKALTTVDGETLMKKLKEMHRKDDAL